MQKENEEPISISRVSETRKYGGVSSAILGRIRWWCHYNKEHKIKNRYYDGEWWSGFMSSKDFEEQTGYNYRTIETHLSKLIKNEVIIKGCFNKKGFDRTSWYRINDLLESSNSIYVNHVDELPESSNSIYVNHIDHLRELGTPIPVNPPVKHSENLSVNLVSVNQDTSIEFSYESIIEERKELYLKLKDSFNISNVTLSECIDTRNEEKLLRFSKIEELTTEQRKMLDRYYLITPLQPKEEKNLANKIEIINL